MIKEYAEVNLHQIPTKTLFKLGFLSNIFLWLGSGLLLGIASIFNVRILPFTARASSFAEGVINSIGVGVLMSLCGTIVFVLGCFLARWIAGDTKLGALLYQMSTKQIRDEAYLEKIRAASRALRQEERHKAMLESTEDTGDNGDTGE
jgi:hypothetical protein